MWLEKLADRGNGPPCWGAEPGQGWRQRPHGLRPGTWEPRGRSCGCLQPTPVGALSSVGCHCGRERDEGASAVTVEGGPPGLLASSRHRAGSAPAAPPAVTAPSCGQVGTPQQPRSGCAAGKGGRPAAVRPARQGPSSLLRAEMALVPALVVDTVILVIWVHLVRPCKRSTRCHDDVEERSVMCCSGPCIVQVGPETCPP